MANTTKYYVIRNNLNGLYFNGSGSNNWVEYFNQASIYRTKKSANSSLKNIISKNDGEELPEVVEIKIRVVEEMQPDDELGYFTAEQVRKMTREQVRDNYTKIIQSMKRWN